MRVALSVGVAFGAHPLVVSSAGALAHEVPPLLPGVGSSEGQHSFSAVGSVGIACAKSRL